MIQKHKTQAGETTFRAYSLRDPGDGDGHTFHNVGSFLTTEECKDVLIAKLRSQATGLEQQALALKVMLESEGWDGMDCDYYNIALIRKQVDDLYEEVYFHEQNVGGLFDPPGHSHHDGLTSLYGEAAIEYAARHGLSVLFAELAGGNFKEGFPVELSPGQAKERLPMHRDKWVWIVAPCDTVEADLPASVLPWEVPEEPLTAEQLLSQAAATRELAKAFEDRAHFLEARALKFAEVTA